MIIIYFAFFIIGVTVGFNLRNQYFKFKYKEQRTRAERYLKDICNLRKAIREAGFNVREVDEMELVKRKK